MNDEHVTETFGPLEADPLGKKANEPGAKLDAGKNRMGLVLNGFPHALFAVGQVATFGANKYSDHGWRKVPNGQERYTDAMLRHLLAEAGGEYFDSETGQPHAAAVAWNALARLELMLSQEKEKAVFIRMADAARKGNA